MHLYMIDSNHKDDQIIIDKNGKEYYTLKEHKNHISIYDTDNQKVITIKKYLINRNHATIKVRKDKKVKVSFSKVPFTKGRYIIKEKKWKIKGKVEDCDFTLYRNGINAVTVENALIDDDYGYSFAFNNRVNLEYALAYAIALITLSHK